MSDNMFFVMSDNDNSHYAFTYWLEKREFNEFETGVKDKRGNPIIKLLNRKSEKNFSKSGLVCCLHDSEETAIRMIEAHLENKK